MKNFFVSKIYMSLKANAMGAFSKMSASASDAASRLKSSVGNKVASAVTIEGAIMNMDAARDIIEKLVADKTKFEANNTQEERHRLFNKIKDFSLLLKYEGYQANMSRNRQRNLSASGTHKSRFFGGKNGKKTRKMGRRVKKVRK